MFNVWNNVLAEIEQKVSKTNFLTWFKDTSLISYENKVAVIKVKSSFIKKQLETKFINIIKEALNNNNILVTDFDFIIDGDKKRKREIETSVSVLSKDIKNNLFDSNNYNGLNNKYTLSNFIVGSNNDLAVAAAKNIINNLGKTINPFFLYGGPGLGKTHLVQAIGNELIKNNPDLKILFISTSNFYTDFINAVQKNKGADFRQKFEKLDVLIIDDIQSIVGKDKSQEEFFNIFNNLHQKNKQIIVTSDRLPDQIKTLDERLSSRLAWGGTYDLQFPSFEERCAILKAKAEFEGKFIENEAVEYIAENIETNIRDLEGELSKILLVADFKKKTPLELINSGEFIIGKNSKLSNTTSKKVLEKTAEYYNLSIKEMCGKSRVQNIKNARQVSMFLLSKEIGLSTNKIAAEVGVKDHTTVMHGIDKINNDLKKDFQLRDDIKNIREQIYA